MSENERSENALLRSRIDEQSELIMILKRRSDEATQNANLLDKRNTLLVAECQKARDDLAVQTRIYALLKSRFDELASNHQQMIEVSQLQLLLPTVLARKVMQKNCLSVFHLFPRYLLHQMTFELDLLHV